MTKVYVKQNHLNYFRRKSRKTNLEIEAYLVGKSRWSTIVVDQFFYPKNYKIQTTGAVQWSDEDFSELSKYVKKHNTEILGSIHSHPNEDTALSPTDFKSSFKDYDFKVAGICSVIDDKSKVRFWTEESLPCEIIYY